METLCYKKHHFFGKPKNSIPKTNSSSHLKLDGWNTFSFPFGAWGVSAYFLPAFSRLLVLGSVFHTFGQLAKPCQA